MRSILDSRIDCVLIMSAIVLCSGVGKSLTSTRQCSVNDLSFDIVIYAVRSKSFRPNIQKPRQMENAVRDI